MRKPEAQIGNSGSYAKRIGAVDSQMSASLYVKLL